MRPDSPVAGSHPKQSKPDGSDIHGGAAQVIPEGGAERRARLAWGAQLGLTDALEDGPLLQQCDPAEVPGTPHCEAEPSQHQREHRRDHAVDLDRAAKEQPPSPRVGLRQIHDVGDEADREAADRPLPNTAVAIRASTSTRQAHGSLGIRQGPLQKILEPLPAQLYRECQHRDDPAEPVTPAITGDR